MSIQIDNGEFTRLHNTIFERLAVARLTASEYRCLFFLFRMTYGWQKKEDTISLLQWAEGTGIDKDKRHNALRTLQGLVAKGVIYCKPNGNNHPATWGFNKNFEQWDASLFDATVISHDNSLPHAVITEDNTTVITPDNTSVMPPDNSTVITPDNLQRKTKKTIKKKGKESIAANAAPGDTPEWQEFISGLCNCCYKHTDIGALSEKDRGLLLSEAKKIRDGGYSLEDIREWFGKEWVNDWRYGEKKNRPTPSQVRSGIPAIRAPGDAAYEITPVVNGHHAASKTDRKREAFANVERTLQERGFI